MRRRLEKFLPIVLIAVLVQVLAPIGATWAASIASDPLHAVPICYGAATSVPDQSSQAGAHDGCCSVCSVVHGGAPLPTPPAAARIAFSQAVRIIWLDATPDLFSSRAGA